MIRLVVFDIAGTTVEDPGGVRGCLKAALATAGHNPDDDAVNAVMGIPKPVAISKLLGRAATPELVSAIHADFHALMIGYYRTDPNVRPITGVEATFQALRHAGIKVALDTGFDREIVSVLLDRLGWGDNLLDATATSDEVGNGRPSPDLILRIMGLAGVESANEVAKVGDTPSDLLSGTAAGCRFVIGVTSGAHQKKQLEAFPHTHIVESVRQVPECLM